jgi:tetratricopeptide (TPR) repeat protein
MRRSRLAAASLPEAGTTPLRRRRRWASRGLHYWRNDREKALADLNAAIELKPDLARAWWARGFFNQSTHDLRKDRELRERIIADYSNAIELKPDYRRVLCARRHLFQL